ncbi:hypothetical protein MMC34_002790 [Xylographa carneopallida]|nr:hypothetical protein [Xylographa carneopallida]
MPPTGFASRPGVAEWPLTKRFVIIKQVSVDAGSYNAGIFKVKDLERGNICIEKKFKPNDIARGIFDNEAHILRRLYHPNVVEYIHAFVADTGSRPSASIYMGLCDLGSLNDLMERYARQGRGFCEEFVWSVFLEMADALGYIQYGIREVTRGTERRNPNWAMIVHNDIYPRNVCLKKRETGWPRLVLADFGVGGEIPVGQAGWEEGIGQGHHTFGAHLRIPPEATVLDGPDWGAQSDNYLLGAMISQMCYQGGTAERWGLMVDRGRLQVGEWYSTQLKEARDAFLRQDWRARPRIMTIAPRLTILGREARDAYKHFSG